MKKLIFILLFLLVLTGCTHTNELGLKIVDYIRIYEMEDFYEESPDSVIEIDDEGLIEEIINILNSAHKQTGAVDMPSPDYRVDLEEDSVFLWLSENSGTVMDTEDTHTIYSISNRGTERLIEILGD